MKKCCAILLAGILLLGLLPAAGAESGKKVTIMVYMCGADLERDNLQGTNNIRVISAASQSPERSEMTLKPAYSPAEALFNRLARPACSQLSPAFLAVIPRANATARYPSMMGTPLRIPRKNQLLSSANAIPSSRAGNP